MVSIIQVKQIANKRENNGEMCGKIFPLSDQYWIAHITEPIEGLGADTMYVPKK